MKSSTLHRAGLSRENMSALESSRTVDLDRNEYSRYIKPQRSSELDVLWRSVGKSNDSRTHKQKAPGVYLAVGFIAGALFIGLISLIAGFSNVASNVKSENNVNLPPAAKANVAIIGADSEASAQAAVISEEKYEVKSGDTLDKIAFRFYGKYDVEKINEIQKLNNITNPSALQIGQVILIPVDKSR